VRYVFHALIYMFRFKKTAKGVSTLIVILATSVLVVCCFSLFQSSIFVFDLSLKKQEYEQKFRIAEGVLNYAIAFCKKNYDQLMKLSKNGKNKFSLDTGIWEISENFCYKTKVDITTQKTFIALKAIINERNEQQYFILGCNLLDQKDCTKNVSQYLIQNWGIRDS